MALINCDECGREISDKATACPHCGNPMNVLTVGDEIVCCPKCGSIELTAEKKGFDVRQAAVGAFFAGKTGLLAGLVGSDDIQFQCKKCGNEFEPDEAYLMDKNGRVSSGLEAKTKVCKKYEDEADSSSGGWGCLIIFLVIVGLSLFVFMR